MKLGISTYTFTWGIGVPGYDPEKKLTAYDLIDKALYYKLTTLQIADNLDISLLPLSEIDRIKRYAADKGISIEIGARGMTNEKLPKFIELASYFNSPILRFVIDEQNFEPNLDEIVQIIKNNLELIKSKKIILAIENHDRLKAQEFKYIIENSDKSYVGICLDSVNSIGAGESVTEITNLLVPYTVNLHLKDFSVRRIDHKMGFVVEGTPAGEGMLDISLLVQKIRLFDRCQSAILELWTPPLSQLEDTIKKEEDWANRSIVNLKNTKLFT